MVFWHGATTLIEYINYQKKILHIICMSKYDARTEPLFKSLNLLKVSDILQLQLLKFYYKYKNRTLPYYLAQLPFITQADFHDHSTRAQNQLRTNKPNHEHARYSIRYQIPKVINSTPMEILTSFVHKHSPKHVHTCCFSVIYKHHLCINTPPNVSICPVLVSFTNIICAWTLAQTSGYKQFSLPPVECQIR